MFGHVDEFFGVAVAGVDEGGGVVGAGGGDIAGEVWGVEEDPGVLPMPSPAKSLPSLEMLTWMEISSSLM